MVCFKYTLSVSNITAHNSNRWPVICSNQIFPWTFWRFERFGLIMMIVVKLWCVVDKGKSENNKSVKINVMLNAKWKLHCVSICQYWFWNCFAYIYVIRWRMRYWLYITGAFAQNLQNQNTQTRDCIKFWLNIR